LPFIGPAPDLGAYESNFPLPVEFNYFSATSEKSNVLLNWITATEVNNYGFEIERRMVNEETWNKIGFIAGAGASNSPKDYSFSDKNITPGHYLYRLKQIDENGSFKYSYEVEVVVGSNPKQLFLSDAYPNPFNPTTNIKFSVPEKSRITLKIYNLLGQEVETLFHGTLEPGEYQKVFHAERMPSGIYVSVLESNNGRQVKKMVLLK
jgi:hypothetical protein